MENSTGKEEVVFWSENFRKTDISFLYIDSIWSGIKIQKQSNEECFIVYGRFGMFGESWKLPFPWKHNWHPLNQKIKEIVEVI